MLVFDLTDQFIRFLDQAIDGWTVHTLRGLAELLKDLVEALDLFVRLVKMAFQSLLEVAVGRLLGKFRESLSDLISA